MCDQLRRNTLECPPEGLSGLGRTYGLHCAVSTASPAAPRASGRAALGGVPPGCEPDAPSTTANGNVTIVTQSTLDRLWNVGHICERWKGPLSLGMMVKHEDPSAVKRDAKRIMAACPRPSPGRPSGRGRLWSSPLAFQPHEFLPGHADEHAELARRIPLTKRGLVRCLANGTAVGLPPPPRWTPQTLHLWEGDAVAGGPRRALAAGEADARRALKHVEKFVVGKCRPGRGCTKTAKQPALRRGPASRLHGHCEPFHHHGSTRFDAWLASGDAASDGPAKPAMALPCFLSNHFEPFVAVPRCLETSRVPGEASHVPRFDERYEGYGKNKIEWIASLRGANYTFRVAPDAFTVHVPHAASSANQAWVHGSEHVVEDNGKHVSAARGHMDALFAEHLAVLGLYDDWRARTTRRPSLAPAARVAPGRRPYPPGKVGTPPWRWAQVDARLALPFAERIAAHVQGRHRTNARHVGHHGHVHA
ncbi:hypothetical protein JL720_12841 [Aureococcus anophagefferens]|nr:hypothetical protein JL720_12841 [Aureococcus anophagefferens]